MSVSEASNCKRQRQDKQSSVPSSVSKVQVSLQQQYWNDSNPLCKWTTILPLIILYFQSIDIVFIFGLLSLQHYNNINDNKNIHGIIIKLLKREFKSFTNSSHRAKNTLKSNEYTIYKKVYLYYNYFGDPGNLYHNVWQDLMINMNDIVCDGLIYYQKKLIINEIKSGRMPSLQMTFSRLCDNVHIRLVNEVQDIPDCPDQIISDTWGCPRLLLAHICWPELQRYANDINTLEYFKLRLFYFKLRNLLIFGMRVYQKVYKKNKHIADVWKLVNDIHRICCDSTINIQAHDIYGFHYGPKLPGILMDAQMFRYIWHYVIISASKWSLYLIRNVNDSHQPFTEYLAGAANWGILDYEDMHFIPEKYHQQESVQIINKMMADMRVCAREIDNLCGIDLVFKCTLPGSVIFNHY